jgi:hypothetical protein
MMVLDLQGRARDTKRRGGLLGETQMVFGGGGRAWVAFPTATRFPRTLDGSWWGATKSRP